MQGNYTYKGNLNHHSGLKHYIHYPGPEKFEAGSTVDDLSKRVRIVDRVFVSLHVLLWPATNNFPFSSPHHRRPRGPATLHPTSGTSPTYCTIWMCSALLFLRLDVTHRPTDRPTDPAFFPLLQLIMCVLFQKRRNLQTETLDDSSSGSTDY